MLRKIGSILLTLAMTFALTGILIVGCVKVEKENNAANRQGQLDVNTGNTSVKVNP